MDERRRVIEYFQKNGVLIQSEAVDFLIESGDALNNSRKLLEGFDEKPLGIVVDDVKKYFDNARENKEILTPPAPPAAPPAITISSAIQELPGTSASAAPDALQIDEKEIDLESNVEILEDVTGKSCCEGTISDFTRLFRNRYETLYGLLKKRQEMKNAIPIKNAQNREGDVSVIGIVSEIKRGKNSHVLVEMEDESDSATIYIPDSLAAAASNIVEDEVIGIVGKGGRGGLIIAQDIIWPDIPLNRKKHYADEESYIAFVSDIHIGSKTFLEREWQRFIKWINGNLGNERQKEVAKKVKYIIMPGDIVEGVGIYPGQEKDLEIEDIYGQYEALAKEMEDIPDRIKIIIQPGNHDAVRPALPQPAFGKEVREIFSDMNAIFAGNPCYLRIEGVEILSYHGQSIQDFSTRIGINQNNPTDIMKSMLQRRHMAPIYGDGTPLAPEKKDYLAIDRVPDIFVTGHIHTTAIDRYRGVLLINASTWQSQTDYQKMMNFSPDPAKVPIVNLKNGHASLMDFRT